MVTNKVTVAAAIRSATEQLGSDTAKLDSQLILAGLLEKNRTWLIAHDDAELSDEQAATFQAQINQRAQGYPTAYLLGQQEFWSLPFHVAPGVLIPRPETELIIEQVCQLHPDKHLTIADLGTGTGAIAIALAKEFPNDTILALDKNREALALASLNRDNLNASSVRLCGGHWLDAFAPDSLDMVVSNPPYIASNDEHLPALVHEPASALVSGADGLDDIREIIHTSRRVLKTGGWLLVEHGYNQQPQILELMFEAGYRNIRGERDLAGQPRVTLAENP